MKKCPPGVICLENMTIVFILVLCVILGWLIYSNMARIMRPPVEQPPPMGMDPIGMMRMMGGMGMMGPIGPAFMDPINDPRRSPWPINVSTRPMPMGSGEFSNCGVLVPASGGGISADQEAADIAAAVADLKAQIQDLSGKVAADDAGLAALQSKLDQIKAVLAL